MRRAETASAPCLWGVGAVGQLLKLSIKPQGEDRRQAGLDYTKEAPQ